MFKPREEYSYLMDDLITIEKPVSYNQEVTKYIRKANGKPILFNNVILENGVKSMFPVISNLAGSRELVAKYLGVKPEQLSRKLLWAYQNPKRADISSNNDYKELEIDLNKLPIMIHYPGEAGRYITSGIVFAYDEEYGLNASYHRMLLISNNKVVARILPRHLHTYISRGVKKIAIGIGNTPEVLVASAMTPPIDVSEMDIANALKPIKLIELDGVYSAPSEIILIGEFTGERHPEGPFVDVTGTYDIIRDEPVIKITKIYHRENAFYHDILPADKEHKLLMGYSKTPSILNELMKVGVDVKDVYLTPGGSSWLHCIIKIRKNDSDDPIKAINAAFKGHKSLKMVIVVDEDIDIYDWESVEWAIATRVQPDRDVYIFKNMKGSSLDPSADQITRKTSKWGIDATIPDPNRIRDFLRVV